MENKTSRIYFDANATCPIRTSVLQRLAKQFSDSSIQLGNPSSAHLEGRTSFHLIEKSRSKISRTLGVRSQDVTFTSSGSEGNQWVIRTVLEPLIEKYTSGSGTKKPSWILTHAEHDSVIKLAEFFESKNWVELLWVPMNHQGNLDWEKLSELNHERGIDFSKIDFVSTVLIQSESGLICDLSKVRSLFPNAFWHVDAVQALSKIDLFNYFSTLGSGKPDALVVSGHKVGSFQGIAAVAMNPNRKLKPVILGNQEHGLRGGTENLAGILSFSLALEELENSDQSFLKLEYRNQVDHLRKNFEERVQSLSRGAFLVGSNTSRTIQTSLFLFPEFAGFSFIEALDLEGISVSQGSACQSRISEPSEYLQSLGIHRDVAKTAVRVSFSPQDPAELENRFDQLVTKLSIIMSRIRKIKGMSEGKDAVWTNSTHQSLRS